MFQTLDSSDVARDVKTATPVGLVGATDNAAPRRNVLYAVWDHKGLVWVRYTGLLVLPLLHCVKCALPKPMRVNLYRLTVTRDHLLYVLYLAIEFVKGSLIFY